MAGGGECAESGVRAAAPLDPSHSPVPDPVAPTQPAAPPAAAASAEGEADFQEGRVEAKLQEGKVDVAFQQGGVAELQEGEVEAKLRTGGLQTELQHVGEDEGEGEAGLQKKGIEGDRVEAESQNDGAEAEDGWAADGAEMSPDTTEPAAAPPSSAPRGDGSSTVEEAHSANEEEARAEPTGQICFVLGGPGSGATTQSMKLAAKYGYTYCGVYKLLQLEVARGSRLAREFSQFVMSGKVVPMRCYADLLAAHIKSDGRYIVDDFPRTPDELTLALRRLRPQAGARDFCLWLDAPEDLRGERLVSRGRSRIKPPPRAPPPAATDAGKASGRAGGQGVCGGGAVASLSHETVESQVLPPASRDGAKPEPSEDGRATGERCREARAASTISAAARGRKTRREVKRRKDEAISREKRMLGRDHPTIIRKRLDAYRARAASLKEHLERASLVLHVDAAQSIESVFALACDAFETRKIND
ncbi:hypothetical protein AB1Y20_018264 [Prymnesium parvum]|uniref:Adenylate kinase n=1 Tax=Prymnesium parvum TaxID=97485 RepID=A0AB34JQD0_PRYPA